MRKNFEDFKELYNTFNLKFSIVCFSETWEDDDKLENDSLTQLPGYNVLHQIRKNRRGGGKYICTRVAVLQSAIRSGHKFGSSGIS